MKNKYGHTKNCQYCGTEFITKPRFGNYCSTPCKNPMNRPGHPVWNKGIKLTEEQKAKQNREGLKKGWGWNKGLPNEQQRQKWLENNPNKNGRANNMRPKNYVDSEFTAYKRECRKATYRSVYAMRKEGVAQITGKKKTDLQLDHIIPFEQGFNLKIPALVIGGRQNLRYILAEENRYKWDTFQPMEIVNKITGGYYVLQQTGH